MLQEEWGGGSFPEGSKAPWVVVLRAQDSMQPVQASLQPGFWTHPCFSWCEGGLGLGEKGYIHNSQSGLCPCRFPVSSE